MDRVHTYMVMSHTYVHAYGHVIAQLCNIHLGIVRIGLYVRTQSHLWCTLKVVFDYTC